MSDKPKKKLTKKEQDKINLRPIKPLSHEEAVKQGSIGGKKSVEKRRQKKLLRETLAELLEMKDPETGEKNQNAINVALLKQALKGNTKAYEVIRDTLGQKIADKVENTTIIQKVFISPEEDKEVEEHIKSVIEGN